MRGSQGAASPRLSSEHPLYGVVAEAYRVFAYPKPSHTGVCEQCCMDPEIEADFWTAPIVEFPARYLLDWYSAAYDPPAVSKDVWVYLLPRILEALALEEEEICSVGTEVILARFPTGRPGMCSPEEWQVVDHFRREFLDHRLTHGTNRLDDLLCMFYLGGWSLEQLHAQVLEMLIAPLTQRLWSDWGSWNGYPRNIWTTAFWPDSALAEMKDFYTSDALHERFLTFGLSDHEMAPKALTLAQMIENPRRALWS